ncbi:very short patch repair endonuclease [Ovoidimarina sediminis]|uniref:very short patch repair endonuclease n=1 Tax=Ovoidimarina sediminis TaxID=3079856 RepID=UPI002910725D|nr:very short patch repair endonuclease [Rhodophyticola sp. MJ-SS7]MDU8945993.1 very short patch repair endonuclease [Rhodophyticola sp. MJ-SS7]
MADVHDKATRSRNMAAIRGADTKPEMMIRRGLHARGFRFRLHDRTLPGRPDMIFPKYRAVLFVHGCFWHGHNCHLFKWPGTREEFWREKIGANVVRDRASTEALREAGWRVGVVWECALKGRQRHAADEVLEAVSEWLHGTGDGFELEGVPDSHAAEAAS